MKRLNALEALKAIADIRANSNSEPDVMGAALERATSLASDALAYRTGGGVGDGIDNRVRADIGFAVLEAFNDVCATDPEDRLGDMLCDLMHYCRQNGIDFENELRRGRGHFEAECAHECQNCQWYGPDEDLHEIQDIRQRVAAGETHPSGQCPDCGALCHLAKITDPVELFADLAQDPEKYKWDSETV